MNHTEADRAASLYRRHAKTHRCACDRCRAFRATYPRTAATEDGIRETAVRVTQYRAGDYS